MKIQSRSVALLVFGLLSPLGCGGVAVDGDVTGESEQGLNVPTAVANMSPSGLVESTGNLYWTRNTFSTETFRWTGSVYRAAKTNVPGQETVLYSEGGTWGSSFGNITFANHGGVWYGYFLASNRYGKYIKRVPLDGSSGAVVLADVTSLASSSSPLQSDGTYVFFAGPNGIYAQPLDGSAAQTIAQATGITAFGFDRAHVYYNSDGGQLRMSMKPNYGTYNHTLAIPGDAITAVYVSAGADNDDSKTSIVYTTAQKIIEWTQTPNHSPSLTTLMDYSSWGSSVQINSVWQAGSRVMWTYSYGSVYYVAWKDLSQAVNVSTGRLVQTGARSVMGDATQLFFIDNYALERLVF